MGGERFLEVVRHVRRPSFVTLPRPVGSQIERNSAADLAGNLSWTARVPSPLRWLANGTACKWTPIAFGPDAAGSRWCNRFRRRPPRTIQPRYCDALRGANQDRVSVRSRSMFRGSSSGGSYRRALGCFPNGRTNTPRQRPAKTPDAMARRTQATSPTPCSTCTK